MRESRLGGPRGCPAPAVSWLRPPASKAQAVPPVLRLDAEQAQSRMPELRPASSAVFGKCLQHCQKVVKMLENCGLFSDIIETDFCIATKAERMILVVCRGMFVSANF